MKLKLLTAAILVAGMSATSLAQAATAAWDCGYTNPPTVYPFTAKAKSKTYTVKSYGGSVWRTCYMDSAIQACLAGDTPEKLNPQSCNATFLANKMQQAQAHPGIIEQTCNVEFGHGYLPAGVTSAMCQAEITKYATGA